MAFFTRDTSFNPLFRLLDDYQSYTGHPHGRIASRTHIPSFQPKFDVRELEDAYELHGELAGISKDNLHIEFSEPHTLHIRGRIERNYTSGTPPASVEAPKAGDALPESDSDDKASTTESAHRATVDDEYAVVKSNENTAAKSHDATKADADTTEKAQSATRPKTPSDPAKYWVSERSIGEFSRTFNFPGHIQQDAVSANLNEGILTVRIPKAPKNKARHYIQIN